jgi:hypothetical protein
MEDFRYFEFRGDLFMAFMVARTEKRKRGDLGIYQIHVDRKTENHSNKDIDNAKSYLNYDLIGHEKDISFHDEVMYHIYEHKKPGRAIRKDAVVLQDWIISSSKDFFDNLSEERTREYFEVAVDYFGEKFGRHNIRFATVHMDETTPHMHLGIVPMNVEGRLTAKTLFNRQALREIQEELPKKLQENGFDIERGVPNSERKHLDTPEFKNMVKSAKKEIQKENRQNKIEFLKTVPEEIGIFVKKTPNFTKDDLIKSNDYINSHHDENKKMRLSSFKPEIFLKRVFEDFKTFFEKQREKLLEREKELEKRSEELAERENKLVEKHQAQNKRDAEILRSLRPGDEVSLRKANEIEKNGYTEDLVDFTSDETIKRSPNYEIHLALKRASTKELKIAKELAEEKLRQEELKKQNDWFYQPKTRSIGR